jgi:hypothetical protein
LKLQDPWVKVSWEGGETNTYRYGQGPDIDLEVVAGEEAFGTPAPRTPDIPATPFGVPQPEVLKTGMRIVRGPTWKWENQDGGAGCMGTVKKDQKAGVRLTLIHQFMQKIVQSALNLR